MVPPLVEKALALTERLGFEKSCRPEVGRLLHLLAASRGRGRVAEIGTGTGVGSAWIVSALPPQVPFFTSEIDEDLAASALELFASDETSSPPGERDEARERCRPKGGAHGPERRRNAAPARISEKVLGYQWKKRDQYRVSHRRESDSGEESGGADEKPAARTIQRVRHALQIVERKVGLDTVNRTLDGAGESLER